tara:strand:+ start:552 stop:665 length:114 start_codon:yes stop_codon:yes gene_type:complete
MYCKERISSKRVGILDSGYKTLGWEIDKTDEIHGYKR